MAYEYGVDLKLNSAQAMRDVDVLLGKLEKMNELAKIKVNDDAINLSKQMEGAIKATARFAEAQKEAISATQALGKAAQDAGHHINKQIAEIETEEEKAARLAREAARKAAREAEKRAHSAASTIIRDLTSIANAAQSIGDRIASSLGNAFVRAGQATINFGKTAFEQYQTLEMAELSFAKLYDGDPRTLTELVKKMSQEMPGLDAADLASAMKSISPIANRNAELAIAAVQGLMKGTLYSGNNLSSFPNLFQNLQQLASGASTAQDTKELIRAIPTLPALLKEVGGEDLLDNGVLSNKKLSAWVKKNGPEALLNIFAKISENSSASDIYEVYRKTWSGIIEETTETIKNKWNDALEKSGAYDATKALLERLTDSGLLQKVFTGVAKRLGDFMNWVSANADTIFNMLDLMLDGIGNFLTKLKDIAVDVLKEIGILDKNNNLNEDRLKEITNKVTEFLTDFISTLATGLPTLLKLLEWGSDKGSGTILGLLASPAGHVGTSILNSSFVQNTAGTALGNVLTDVFKAKPGAGAGILGLGKGVVKAGAGVGIYAAGSYLTDLATESGILSKEFNGLGKIVSAAAGGLATFGPLGAVIGICIEALRQFTEGLNNAGRDISKEADEWMTQLRDRTAESKADQIIEKMNMNGAGINTSTELGGYIRNQILEYYKTTAISKWNDADAIARGGNAAKYKQIALGLADLDNTSAYQSAASGTNFNLTALENQETLKSFANLIREYHLLGDQDDLYKGTDEATVRNLLNGNAITAEQISMYLEKATELDTSLTKTTTDITDTISKDDEFLNGLAKQSTDLFSTMQKYFEETGAAITEYVEKMAGNIDNLNTINQADIKDANNFFSSTYWTSGGPAGQLYRFISGLLNSTAGNRSIITKDHYLGKANGGIIESQGIDTVPALLAPGEFVMRNSAVKKWGRSAMEALNYGDASVLSRALSNNVHSSWDYSRTSNTTNNNQQATQNFFFNGQLSKRSRMPYTSFRNRRAGV